MPSPGAARSLPSAREKTSDWLRSGHWFPFQHRLLGEPPKMNDALKEKLGETPLVDAETIEEAHRTASQCTIQ